jgi:hypothetical protein
MRVAAGLWLVAFAVAAAPASAQGVIGEVRMLGTAAWAPGADVASRPAGGYPLPKGRTLAGASAGLSFVSGGISAGPEALVLRGSDRKMFAVGGVARVGITRGAFRPYLLLGAGVYSWNHKAALPPALSSPGQGATAFWLGDVTQWAGNAGGGIAFGRERLSLLVELRGHRSLNQDDWSGTRDAVTFSVGGRVSW